MVESLAPLWTPLREMREKRKMSVDGQSCAVYERRGKGVVVRRPLIEMNTNEGFLKERNHIQSLGPPT